MDAINKSLTGKAVAPLPDSAESLEDYVFRAWSLLAEEFADESVLALEFELENQAEAYPGFDAPPGRGEAPYREIREMHAESCISLTEDCIELMSEFEPEPPVEFKADELISPALDDDACNMTVLSQAPLILQFSDAPLRMASTSVLTAQVSVSVPASVAASVIRSTAKEGAAAAPVAQVSQNNPQAASTPTVATTATTPAIPAIPAIPTAPTTLTFAPNVLPHAASAQPIHALHMPSTDVDIRPAAMPHETKKALLLQAVFDALPIAQPMPERLIPALPNTPAPMQGNPQSHLQNGPQSSRHTDVASSEAAALPASAGDAGNAAVVAADGGSTSGSTLIYRFDKWGDGHAVTVQSQAQAQAETPHYTLLPSNSVVGQRLSEQLALAAGAADMPLMSMSIPLMLTEDADERDRQRPPLPLHNEEDEEDAS